MGAYLSTPLTEKESTDEANEYLACGASQMQGWRMSQEDAHICSLDFDKSTSLFAVFDGHGGSEVALYCSKKLPEFLKNTDAYQKSDYERALKDAFLGFDATLVNEEIIKELKELMPADKDGENSDEDMDDEEDEISELQQEGRMPLNELLEKLKEAKNIPLAKLKQGEASNAKPLSPCLRGRRSVPSADEGAQNGASNASAKRQIDVDAAMGEEEAVSSSSASAAVEKSQSSSEPSSSSITGSDANPENGPSSTISAADSISKSDIANSPVSSSTADKKDGNATEPSSESNKIDDPSNSHADGVEGGSSSPSKKVEADVNGKAENVSSSSAAENGIVASSDAAEPSQAEKSQNKISSSAKLPSLNESGDGSSSDGSYNEEGNEAKSDTEEEEAGTDDDDEEGNEASDDEEEGEEEADSDDADDDSDDEMNAQDFEDDEKFLNNMFEGPGSSSGCTAVVALLAGNELYVANAGDSRCVVCRNGAAMDMSFDHKPEDAEELERIQKAGGRVTLDGRVNGGLNLSRAIGDHAYKTNKDLKAEEQMISAMPDVKRATITAEDEFMILACDGIWNSLTSEEVVKFVRSRIVKGETRMSAICEELFSKCLAPNTFGDGTGCDNMTALIIQFKPSLASEFQKNKASDAIGADVTTTSSTASKKRVASPTQLIDDPNADSHKRIKTDDSVAETVEPASA